MRWPFSKRVDPAHAWGTLAVATAALVGIPAVLATVHASASFDWWWPTNWMFVPAIAFLAGLLLLAVPLRNAGAESKTEHHAGAKEVTGEVKVRKLAGDAAGVRIRTLKGASVIRGKAQAKTVAKGAELAGAKIDVVD